MGTKPDGRLEAVAALAERLGLVFHDPSRLERALTHASVGDGAKAIADNERLEFLGDRVLGLVVAERLIKDDEAASEGDLASRLNLLVSRAACARVARRIGLGPALRMSGAETRAGGRDKDSILAGAVEAVIAAVHLDAGWEAARDLVLTLWAEDFAARVTGEARPKDDKTRLQEWAQGQGLALPAYRVARRSGPEHAPCFEVEVAVEGLAPALGEGRSRQLAEKAAAAALLAREGGAAA